MLNHGFSLEKSQSICIFFRSCLTSGVKSLNANLVNTRNPPKFDMPQIGLQMLLNYGHKLVEEQDNVKRVQLADEYLEGASLAGSGGSLLA